MKVATIVLDKLNEFKNTNVKTKTSFLVSHVPPLMLFLRYYFEQELGLSNDNILDKIGGFLEPLSGFVVNISGQTTDDLSMELVFERKRNDGMESLTIPFSEEKLRQGLNS